MLGGLLRRFAGGAAPAAEILPENLDLAQGQGVRVIKPLAQDGYASIVNTAQGFFIFNRNDLGVGWQLSTYNAYDPEQMHILADMVRATQPAPVILDIGANIGVAAVVLARVAGPRGQVHAFEPQRLLFHMLAGNIALNGLDNVHCHLLAVGAGSGTARLPRLNYRTAGNFGSVELNRAAQSDAQQQALDGQYEDVPTTSIDLLGLPRVDMIKVDVEGMEDQVLAGATRVLREQRPLLYLEFIKSDKASLWRVLDECGYLLYEAQGNFVCIHGEDSRRATLIKDLQPWRP